MQRQRVELQVPSEIDKVNEGDDVSDLEKKHSCVRLGNLVNFGELKLDLLA
jgi:hypothetical protein